MTNKKDTNKNNTKTNKEDNSLLYFLSVAAIIIAIIALCTDNNGIEDYHIESKCIDTKEIKLYDVIEPNRPYIYDCEGICKNEEICSSFNTTNCEIKEVRYNEYQSKCEYYCFRNGYYTDEHNCDKICANETLCDTLASDCHFHTKVRNTYYYECEKECNINEWWKAYEMNPEVKITTITNCTKAEYTFTKAVNYETSREKEFRDCPEEGECIS